MYVVRFTLLCLGNYIVISNIFILITIGAFDRAQLKYTSTEQYMFIFYLVDTFTPKPCYANVRISTHIDKYISLLSHAHCRRNVYSLSVKLLIADSSING